MRLAVVIPCHHRVDLLATALAAVRGWPVVVVDDSPDGQIRVAAGAARRVRTAGEVGFAAAVNAGLAAAEAAGAELALVLNDDAAPAAGCVEALLAAWGPGVGAVGPVIVGPEGVESAGIAVSGWGRVRQRRRVPRGEGPVEVAALSGAALLIGASARFDEGYRHGFEDVALCLALRAAGRRLLLLPEARCHHLGGASLPRTSRAAQRHAVSGHARLLRQLGRPAPIAAPLAVAQILREGGPWDRLLGVVEGLWDSRAQPAPCTAASASSRPGSSSSR